MNFSAASSNTFRGYEEGAAKHLGRLPPLLSFFSVSFSTGQPRSFRSASSTACARKKCAAVNPELPPRDPTAQAPPRGRREEAGRSISYNPTFLRSGPHRLVTPFSTRSARFHNASPAQISERRAVCQGWSNSSAQAAASRQRVLDHPR